MAVYNTERFLPEAIESVTGQTYGQWELICINDGSTDRSLEVLEQYRGKDPRIVVLSCRHCGTAAGARNHGLAVARGRYVAMLDSDDKLEPRYLEKLLARKEQTQANIVLASAQYWTHGAGEVSRSLTGVRGDTATIVSGREALALSLHWEIGAIGLHDADSLRKVKYCEVGMNGDEYTTRLLFLYAARVAFCDALYFYRANPESTTGRFSYKWFSSILTRAMVLTLIREHKLDRRVVLSYREEVVMALVYSYVGFVRKRRVLPAEERVAVRGWLAAATRVIGKELLLSPFSIRSSGRIVVQIAALIARQIGKWSWG